MDTIFSVAYLSRDLHARTYNALHPRHPRARLTDHVTYSTQTK